MARIVCKAALSFLLWIGCNGAEGVSLIDGNGAVMKNVSVDGRGQGVVALLTSPADSSLDPLELSATESGDGWIVTSPGATLTGSSALSKGNGAAAAALVSGCIVLSGITPSDLENGLDDTRHGHTLNQLFSSRLELSSSSASPQKTTLILAVPPSSCADHTILEDVQHIFDSAVAGMDNNNNNNNDSYSAALTLTDLYTIQIVKVESDDDMNKVMEMAREEAAKSPYSGDVSVTSAITAAYSKLNKVSAELNEPQPSIAAAILACDDAYSRQTRAVRARLAGWKARVMIRGLWVDKFGSQATDLLQKTMESYDRDTLSAAGLTGTAAPYRLQLRSKLQARMERSLKELYDAQVSNVEKSSLSKFESVLLRKWKNREDKTVGTQAFYNDNATVLRTAAFNFDSIMDDLAIPSLSLTKAKANAEFTKKLDAALLSFPDSPAARLSGLQKVNKAVSKQKKPKEPSVDIGLDVVAMIRPDGYGTFQGFAGYQLGGNNIICGLANDADSPDVISQFGGVRPPFVRIQPKLKLDVEL